MKFSIDIKDTSSVFYRVCRNNGQAFGMAIPYLLEEQGLFSIVFDEGNKPFLTDKNGKTYCTHHNNKGHKYNIAPSYQKGFGRKYSVKETQSSVLMYDYHIFTSLKLDSVCCVILSSKEALILMNKESGEVYID